MDHAISARWDPEPRVISIVNPNVTCGGELKIEVISV
jgi:hypothetical protein